MPPMLPSFSPNFIMYCLGLASYVEPLFVDGVEAPDFTLTAVIPVFNEEKSVARTISSILDQTKKPTSIIVVDDGSTDNTNRIASSFNQVRVLRNPVHMGKAGSINRALEIVDTDLVMLVDADTVLENSFTEKALEAICGDAVAASGFVTPSMESSNPFIRKARVVEDFYSQTTLKRGQNMVNGLFVVSGCCAVFKTPVLKKFLIPTETVTEDLDLTWLIEREGYKLNLVDAYAYTLEPKGLKEYVSQIRRWYTGFFQSLSKHKTKVLESKPLTLTLTLIFLECLVFTIFWASAVGLVALLPWLDEKIAFLRLFVLTMLGIDLFTVCFPAVFKARSAGALGDFLSGLPLYYFLRVVNAFVWWATFVEWLFGWGANWEKNH